MKHCPSCDININTNEKYCPLCQNKLEGKCISVYPTLISKKKNFWLKLILFLVINTIFICCYINYLISSTITWSIWIIPACISGYILFYYFMTSYYKDYYRLFNRLIFIIILLSFIWYFVTKSTIITNIIIPTLCVVLLILSSSFALTLKEKYIRKYIDTIFNNILISLVPLVLVKTGIATNKLGAYISFALAIITILGLIIFDYNEIKEEIKKIFNF